MYITVINPDDALGVMPLYDGDAADAHRVLKPGHYPATDPDGNPRVLVVDNGASRLFECPWCGGTSGPPAAMQVQGVAVCDSCQIDSQDADEVAALVQRIRKEFPSVEDVHDFLSDPGGYLGLGGYDDVTHELACAAIGTIRAEAASWPRA